MFSWLLSLILSLSIFSGTDTSSNGNSTNKPSHNHTTVGAVANDGDGLEKTVIIEDSVIK